MKTKGRAILSYLVYRHFVKRLDDSIELDESEKRTDIEGDLAGFTEEQRKILSEKAESFIDDRILWRLTSGVFEEPSGHLFQSVNDDSFFIISIKQRKNGATNIVLYVDEEGELQAFAYVF